MEYLYKINLKVNPEDIDFINKIFEGFDNLALVTTIDNKQGLLRINVTPGTREDVLKILSEFPREIQFYPR
ncbi:MAG: DUF4911 domain-containing protein [Clostridia bacterium]|jgi:hypothetical protein|nr:DUF4911 domain-containing protein [Clostridia bacterium]